MKRSSILFASLMVGSIAYGKGQPVTAHADLINSQGEKIGTVKLTQSRKGVEMAIDASNLPPGVHGFHFHTAGKCDPPDFKTAEGHLNPEGKKHGLKNPDGPHAGDMQNVTVGADGTLKLKVLDPRVTLREGKDSLFQTNGTAIVIHEKMDDDMTDPAGNSGNRIACGVVSK
jgi:superoxide dismutase, Cu-Zn family